VSKIYKIKVDIDGMRLDKYISSKYPKLSRTYIQKLVSEGYVTVNDDTSRSSRKLSRGDQLNIAIPPTIPSDILPESIPLNIVYENKDIFVVDKPAGLTVHPAPGNPKHTLVNAILAHTPILPSANEPMRPGIVHRLDKDTSGLIVIAKTRIALTNLMYQFKSRTVLKKYSVLVNGQLTPNTGKIEAPIGRNPHNRKRMAIMEGGRPAITEYQAVKYFDDFTLLVVKPQTGRTHQIRVHLWAINHPVVGDTTYGSKSTLLARQFIHASRLGFKLPSNDEYVEFTSELPPDLRECIRLLARRERSEVIK